MDDKENVNDILDELRRVFSNLTKEEQKALKEEIVSEISSQNVPPDPALPPVSPGSPVQQAPHTDPVTKSLKKPVTPPSTSARPVTPPPSTSPQAGKTEPTPQKPPAPVSRPEAGPSKDEDIFRVACFYPRGRADAVEIFRQNLTEALRIATKKQYYVEIVVRELADSEQYSPEVVVSVCSEQGLEGAFILTQQPLEMSETPVFNRSLPLDRLTKRFAYIDLAIELLLARKRGKNTI